MLRLRDQRAAALVAVWPGAACSRFRTGARAAALCRTVARMKSYNGYSGTLRDQAQRWLNAQWRAGTLVRPARCMACGQMEGPIDAHAEDYSLPFAAGKTDEFHLCFVCHMGVHCRFKNPLAWDTYRDGVRMGLRLTARGRNFPLFLRDFTSPGLPGLMIDPHHGLVLLKMKPTALDVIDGWLLEHTGKGWR